MSIMFDGHHIGDLHVRPGTDQMLLSRALDQLVRRPEWSKLGADLAALGPHRLAIAARAATAAAGGGRGVGPEEEERIAQWFAGIVDEAIRRGELHAAIAIWIVLVGDNHADPFETRAVRCPVVAKVPHAPGDFESDPGTPGEMAPDPTEVATFLAKLRAAAPGYVRTAIACASDADILEFRELVVADDRALEDYRPWAFDLAEVEPLEPLENARSLLTRRYLSNLEACGGVAEWAHGFTCMVVDHSIPPVFRLGAIAWLARVALQPEGVHRE